MMADCAESYMKLVMLESYLNSGLMLETLVSLGSGINSFKLSSSTLTYMLILISIITTLKNWIQTAARTETIGYKYHEKNNFCSNALGIFDPGLCS
jgi:hypothetical protein